MALAQADWSQREAGEPRYSAEAAAVLHALAAADEAGAPAWADVLARAAALPVCACRMRSDDDA
jgi:hypothetical protein